MNKKPELKVLDVELDGLWAVEGADDGWTGHLSGAERDTMWSQAFVDAVSHAWCSIAALRRAVKSPIEEVFIAALWSRNGYGGLWRRALVDGEVIAESPYDHDGGARYTIQPQARVGPYAADFLITLDELGMPGNVSATVAVELDGHDFHEKTKAQAAHDKKRDRFFTTSGVAFLRFTGSEIHRDPVGCVDEVLSLLTSRVRAALKGHT